MQRMNSLGWWMCVWVIGGLQVGCGGGSGSASSEIVPPVQTPTPSPSDGNNPDPLDVTLAELIGAANLTGDASFNRTLPLITDPLAQLGRKLFFSKSLGGNFDSACVTCHHPTLGGSDGLSLSVGTGARAIDVLGPGRVHAATELPNVPRNSPSVFNVGLWDTGLFLDSRVESFGKEPQANGEVSSIRTPDVAFGLSDPDAGPNLASAQARFPVTSEEEMRGTTFEVGGNNIDVRNHLAARLGDYGVGAGELLDNQWLPEFQAAFGNGTAVDLITFDNIGLALGEYERSMVFIDNPFGAYVNGDLDALTDAQKRGAILFFTEADDDGAGCASCHSGDAFTDGEHHTVAFPQFGPGKGDGTDDDFGRERESAIAADRYSFRTPSLLNIAVTAPYGHAGSYETLGQVLAHYNNPNAAVDNFFEEGACGLAQFENIASCAGLYPEAESNTNNALQKLQQERDAGDTLFVNVNLNNDERNDIVAFLNALTDPCVTDRACLGPWIAETTEDPDGQQLNGRDGNGDLL